MRDRVILYPTPLILRRHEIELIILFLTPMVLESRMIESIIFSLGLCMHSGVDGLSYSLSDSSSTQE